MVKTALCFAAITAVAADASASTTCEPSPQGQLCTSAIDFNQFAEQAYMSQLQSEWCWAASISMLFAFHGHYVSQAHIVEDAYGVVENIPAMSGLVIANELNMCWSDDLGQTFQARVTGAYDFDSGIRALSNSQIVNELDQDRPLLYGNRTHAMVLTAVQYYETLPQPNIVAAGVFDPWPGIGARGLSLAEMTPMDVGGDLRFLATVSVTDVDCTPSPPPTDPGDDDGGGTDMPVGCSSSSASPSAGFVISLWLFAAVVRRRRSRRRAMQSAKMASAVLVFLVCGLGCGNESTADDDDGNGDDEGGADARLADAEVADAANAPPGVEGIYSGIWSASSNIPEERPALFVLQLIVEGNVLSGSAFTFETVVGAPEVFAVVGVASPPSFNASLTHPAVGCMGSMPGASISLSGEVFEADLSVVYSGHNCDILYKEGLGVARRASAPARGSEHSVFYVGNLFNYPSESYGGMTFGIDLTNESGQLVGSLHTYNLETGREVYLQGTGSGSLEGDFDMEFSGGILCPASFHLEATHSGAMYSVSMEATVIGCTAASSARCMPCSA